MAIHKHHWRADKVSADLRHTLNLTRALAFPFFTTSTLSIPGLTRCKHERRASQKTKPHHANVDNSDAKGARITITARNVSVVAIRDVRPRPDENPKLPD
ncbi:hypothetical protein IG631_23320 [Alternaria alternata]|nr:hypothetical protein IG631_23320 [Alternaria alternata]